MGLGSWRHKQLITMRAEKKQDTKLLGEWNCRHLTEYLEDNHADYVLVDR